MRNEVVRIPHPGGAMTANREAEPRRSQATVRQELAGFLTSRFATALEISGALGISEKEVADHLSHLRKSAVAKGLKLLIEPAECLSCGFRFAKREKLGTPGRCPVCRSERIEPPRFGLS